MAFDGRLISGIGVLAAVVETGNFARAGDALGLTPSGVSRAVTRLEARVGVRLFDRSPRAVTLTDEGRRFHTQVAPLLAGLEEATVAAAGAGAGGGPPFSSAGRAAPRGVRRGDRRRGRRGDRGARKAAPQCRSPVRPWCAA